MTRIIYSTLPLLMLAMGVVTFDHWGNTVNIPDDKSDEIEENSLFPVRHIRPSICSCDSEPKFKDFGPLSHPRYLVSNPCTKRYCVRANKCRDIPYTVNVSLFRENTIYDAENSLSEPRTCTKVWRSVAETILVACVPVPLMRQE